MAFYSEGKVASDTISFVESGDCGLFRVQLAVESYKGRAKTSKFCLIERYFYVNNVFNPEFNGSCYNLVVLKTFKSKREALTYFETNGPVNYSLAMKKYS